MKKKEYREQRHQTPQHLCGTVLYQPHESPQGRDLPAAVQGQHRCRMGADRHEGISQSGHLEPGKGTRRRPQRKRRDREQGHRRPDRRN